MDLQAAPAPSARSAALGILPRPVWIVAPSARNGDLLRRSRATRRSSGASAISKQVLIGLDVSRERVERNAAGPRDLRQAWIDMRDAHRNFRPKFGQEIDDRAEAAISLARRAASP